MLIHICLHISVYSFGQASLPSNWRAKSLPINHYASLLLYGWQAPPVLPKGILEYFKAQAIFL